MQFESVAISSLQFDPANARKHSKKNLDAIKGSLTKFGQQKPIVVDANGVVVAGNGTLTACRELGWESIGIVRTSLVGPDAIAFALADNRTAELADWDLDVMGPLLKSLKDIDFDLESIGFDDKDLAKLLPEESKAGLCDDDEVPEVIDTRCKPGDLWQLGAHRLLCGDSTNVQHVERLMGEEKADMVFTDPPYGMNAVSKSGVLSKNYDRDIIGDDNTNAATDSYRLAAGLRIPKLVFWGANYFASALPDASCWLVWDKNNGGSDQMDCELAWTNLKGVTRQFTQASEKTNRVHPTQKPVALAEWCFDRYDVGDVLDLFLGSGSTLIACEKTNRRCFGMEIDPHYCDVILSRWEKFTGKTAIQCIEDNNEVIEQPSTLGARSVGKPRRKA